MFPEDQNPSAIGTAVILAVGVEHHGCRNFLLVLGMSHLALGLCHVSILLLPWLMKNVVGGEKLHSPHCNECLCVCIDDTRWGPSSSV